MYLLYRDYEIRKIGRRVFEDLAERECGTRACFTSDFFLIREPIVFPVSRCRATYQLG